MSLKDRVLGMPRELKLFAVASLAMGMAYSVYDSTFNNFVNSQFTISPLERSIMEFPRELPGLLALFVSALLWFLCSRRLGAFSLAIGAVGTLLIGFATFNNYYIMLIWLFVYSLGQHTMMPVTSTVGMELAKEGKTGQRLGQLNALRNLAAILGSLVVFVGFHYLGFSFQVTFIITGVALAFAAVLLFFMKRQPTQRPQTILKLRREYWLFYTLAVLYGSRKQLFITFAPWVLVTVFNQPTEIMATLMIIGGIIGILFQPLLGWMIDHFGERTVLASEAVLLVFVCFGYGFSKFMFPESTAFLIVCACYLLDQMLMSVSMARSTFMKKIALDPSHIQPALTASVSIDHVFSIVIAIIGGAVWNAFGFQYVFLMGTLIAAINFFFAIQVRVPGENPIPVAQEG